MAGRGTDIQLGGNLQMRIERELADVTDEHERQRRIDKIKADIAEKREKVLNACEVVEIEPAKGSKPAKTITFPGGLYIIGTERHESRRIDNQLRGRAGRQGDPGRSKFYLSLEDDLMRIFASERMDSMLKTLGLREDEAIAHPWVNKALEKAQQKVEARNFDVRRQLLRYDNVMNDQRKVIYSERKELMAASDLSEDVKSMREEVINELVTRYIPEKAFPEQWETTGLHEEVLRVFGINLPIADWAKEEGIAEDAIRERVTDAVDRKMAEKAARYGPEVMRIMEKNLLLQLLDQNWKEHLLALDHLKQGIYLRGFAQRDPLNEYKREAFDMFEGLMSRLREQITQLLSLFEIRQQEAPPAQQPPQAPQPQRPSATNGADPNNPASWKNVSRNAACPCGSGKKYKHCHGKLASTF
jgi:preprotein translocase subunit SecA